MRTTSDRKPHNLIVRINDETKERLNEIAMQKDISVSEFIRNAIENAMQNKDIAMQNSNNAMRNDVNAMQNENNALQKEIDMLKEFINTLRTRVTPEAQELWDNKVFTGIIIDTERQPMLFADDREVIEDIQQMARCWNVSFSDLLSMIQDKLDNGDLNIEGGELVILDKDLREAWNSKELTDIKNDFFDACDTRGKDKVEILVKALKTGLDKARSDLWSDKQGGSNG